jgi:glycosyltransferase involved in cell wall biosynthesis
LLWDVLAPGGAFIFVEAKPRPFAVTELQASLSVQSGSQLDFAAMTSILYLTRNGLLEPLGQSQVFSYLRGLARDHQISLVSREKLEDWANPKTMTVARADCEAAGIRWLPRPFRSQPKGIAPALDIAAMVREALREVRSGRTQLIHARSYIPAAVAWQVWRLTGTPFIFDMRALWPEELVTAGRLRRGSVVHRAIVAIERACLRDATAVVSLTHAAVRHLRKVYPRELERQKVVVIPTCTDLDRFTNSQVRNIGPRVYGCVGTLLSGWFRTDWLAALFAAAAARDPSARFEVVTRDNPQEVRRAIDAASMLGSRLKIGARRPQDMPEAVRSHDVSVMFFTDGLSRLGCSPTRMGEALGCGLPVIANGGVGDVARIVTEHRVGVLAASSTDSDMTATLDTLDALMADPDLAARCRAAAEAVFSLEGGVAAYDDLYRRIADESSANSP